MIQIQSTILQKVQVNLEFPVHFTQNLFGEDNTTFVECISSKEPHKRHKAIFFIDDGMVHEHNLVKKIECYINKNQAHIDLVTKPIIIPGGEKAKNNEKIVNEIHKHIEHFQICRHSFAIVIGGGAVLDMVGFACATPHRGVRLIRIPTTVLSQNDSAMGVKNAINAFAKKNFLGTFCAPYAVINDREFLKSLCFRDWISGISEAVKVAVIKDKEFFHFIKNHTQQLVARDLDAMEKLIFRCAELHLEHIRSSGDPFELGYSRPLDFGHWSAHKLESLSNYEIRHGEAVAAGIALDTYYAHQKNLILQQERDDILQVLDALKFPLFYHEMQAPSFINGLQEFREHLGGTLCITLPNGLGQKIEVNEMDHSIIFEAISFLKENFSATGK